jgi:hypothetical protein
MLAAAEEVSEDGQDIFALDQGVIGSNDRVVECMNYITTNLSVENLEENLLNRGRIRIPYSLHSDYENIFELPGLSRRNARPLSGSQLRRPMGQLQLVSEWAEMCLEDLSKTEDQYLPGDMTCFEELMAHGMPARLDLDSWIARIMLNIVADDLENNLQLRDCLQQWQPWMGTDRVLYQRLGNGQFTAVLAFLGEAKPGRLVWAPMTRYTPLFGVGSEWVQKVEQMLKRTEAALVALARRIARHVASCIVYHYAAPEAEKRGYGILSRKQIGMAVREILGEEWFDLPFDVDGSLRKWSEDDVLKPDDEMDGMDVFVTS